MRGGKLIKSAAMIFTLLIFVSASYAADSSVDYSTDVNEMSDENSNISPEAIDEPTYYDGVEEQTGDEFNDGSDENQDYDDLTEDYYYLDDLIEEPSDIEEEYFDEYLPEEYDDTIYDEYLPEEFYEEYSDENSDSEDSTDYSDYTEDGSETGEIPDEYLDEPNYEDGSWDDLLDNPVDLYDETILYKELTTYEPTENQYDFSVYTSMSDNVNNGSIAETAGATRSTNDQPLNKNNQDTLKTDTYQQANQKNDAQGDNNYQTEITSNPEATNTQSINCETVTPEINISGNLVSLEDKGIIELIMEFLSTVFFR